LPRRRRLSKFPLVAREIVIWPWDKVLTTPAKPVTEFGPALDKLLEEMKEAMIEAEGVGIAAPQIGVPLRVSWVAPEERELFEIVNPEILETSEPCELREGCLSVPGEFEVTPRFRKVRVKYQDRTGKEHQLVAEDRLAHILQHEIDHLNGTVFVLKLSSLKRDLIRSKMKRFRPATS
jgi:peptide deformylase